MTDPTLYRRVQRGKRVHYEPAGIDVWPMQPGLWLVHCPEPGMTRRLCLDPAGELPDPMPLASFALLLPDIESAIRECMDRWQVGARMSAADFTRAVFAAVRERLAKAEGNGEANGEHANEAPETRMGG